MPIAKVALLVLLVSIFFSAQDVAASDEDVTPIPEYIMSEYLAVDFSDVLAPYTQVPRYQLNITDRLGFDKKVTRFSDLEVLVFSNYETESGIQFGCAYTIRRAIEYCQVFGEIPENGIHLLRLYTGKLLTEDGFGEWSDASPIVQFEKMRRAISPATGKVYPSFQCTEWQPLGILIEKLTGENAFKLMPFTLINPNTGDTTTEFRVYQTWRIVVYGEEPDSVLMDKLYWTEVDGVGATTGSCGGCRPKVEETE